MVSPRDPYAAQLSSFLAGDPVARAELPALLAKQLHKLARKFGPRLAADLHDDVVQRGWELLLTKRPEAFDPGRGTAMTYLAGIVHTAARDISAIYSPPGYRTRRRAGEKRQAPLSLEEPINVDDNGFKVPLRDIVPQEPDPIELELSKIHVENIVATMGATGTAEITQAAALIATEHISVTQAAEEVGLSRLQLHRRFRAWGQEHMDIAFVA